MDTNASVQRADPTDSPRPVYQTLAEDIQRLGVDTCFGLMSDDTIGLVAALDAVGVRFCAPRHETNAVLAAEGYAAATGRLGIAVIGRGPAAANGMHGIMVAARSGSPVLIIMGSNEPAGDPNAVGPDYKAYDAPAVMTAAGLKAFTVSSPQTARSLLATAAAAAMRGAAVTLHIPASIQNALHCYGQEALPALPPAASSGPDPRGQAVNAAAAVLRQSRKPLIVAGLGAHRAGARGAIERLAETIGALLITSFKGKDFFRGNPFDLGVNGSFSHSLARKYVDQADCVIVFGASLNFYTTSKGTAFPDVPIIQVDAVRGNIGRWHPADVAVVGDARLVATALTEALSERTNADAPFRRSEVRDEIARFRVATDFKPDDTAHTLDPRTLAVRLEEILPRERNLIYDAGNFIMVATYLSVPGPGHLKVSSDFASMGAGFGTALGFAVARPEETNVLIIGDGGFVMAMSELETVARSGISLVIVVVNDCAYGAELQFCRLRNLPESTSVFPDVDFAPVAEALGFQAATIRTVDDLERCRAAFGDWSGPILLDCKVNADVQAPFIAELLGHQRH